VTDRYAKAIEQLGSDKLDVRIGGIYALERIARDSSRDHPTVIEVLSAFVRVHSLERWPPLPADDQAGVSHSQRKTRPDVQAAMTVIGRRITEHDRKWVDLQHADLTSADLSYAVLTKAVLINTDFTGAFLCSADLTGADLTGADLTGAFLGGADLTRADLTRADLTGADLSIAVLDGTDLRSADLTGALWPWNGAIPEGWELDADSGRLRRIAPAAETERNQAE
jgi:hypothetical protein